MRLQLARHLCWTVSVCCVLFTTSSTVLGEEPYGIEKRAPWTTSKITGSPEPPLPFRIARVFPNLTFTNPVELVTAPGCDRLFMVEVDGKIHSFANDPKADKTDVAFDLKDRIEDDKARVYSLTFHPKFETNRYCYICYTTKPDIDHGTHVSRFKVDSLDPPHIDWDSEELLISWKSGGHNGCCLKFGPDGCLYISTGDGGPAFPPDPLKSGQDVSNLRSSVLRIDVDHPNGDLLYSIPKDNPFVELDGARGEVWAYGFRNPWRMSFDPKTGDLWVGDVGWELWEMIYRVVPGGNYGWSLVEASQPVHRERKRGPTPILPPTIEHPHIVSRSITGGLVYHGTRLEDLAGQYIYGDYVTGKIWGATFNDAGVTKVEELVDTSLQIICFGEGPSGQMYIVDYHGGIYQLEANEQAGANTDFPKRLSETGLFAAADKNKLAPGVIPYSINAEPWADNTTAERFVALPGEESLGIHDKSNVQIGYIQGTWKFPSDTVLGKTISLEMETGNPASRRRLETQILHFDKATWRGYTYIWNDEQTDAELAPNKGIDRSYSIKDAGGMRTQTWHFASRGECILCHTTRGGTVYGFNPEQLNREHAYGTVTDNQLRALSHIGLFEKPASPNTIPSPYDESADLGDRARSYLHINCAHCHRRGGGGTAAIVLQRELTLDKMNMLDERPTQGTFGIHNAKVVAPGDPYRSVMYYRLAKIGRGRMPYFGSNIVDRRGLKLIHDWVKSLPSDAKLIAAIAAIENGSNLEANVATALSTSAGALRLQRAIDDGRIKEDVRAKTIELAIAHEDIRIRDLFERFVPEEERTKRLGTSMDPAQLLALRGNVDLGRKLFFETTGVQCKNCHKIQGKGMELGPDLTKIGKKYNRAQLLETILKPSKAIDPKYLPYLVETVDGRVLTGLLAKKDDQEIVLKDAKNKEIKITASDVELLAPHQISLMPELLLQDMTRKQVADLLEFLQTLK